MKFYCAIQHFSETLQAGLFSTGVLWSFCDRIPLLPKSNNQAVNKILRKEEQLIDDAIKELDEVTNFKRSLILCFL